MPGGTPNERYHRGHYMKFLPVFFLSEIKISWVGQSTRGQIDFHKKKTKKQDWLILFSGWKSWGWWRWKERTGRGGCLIILYDFSGHKPDLEGKIQICFRYGFSRPVPVYKHWDSKSARPDPYVSTQKAGIRKPVLSSHWESRFFQTCHLSKIHGGQV